MTRHLTGETASLAPRMRTLLILSTLALVSCRDEQAGPKNRQASAPSPSGAQAVQALDAAPPLTFESGATLGGGLITYLGSIVEPKTPKPGQQVTLRHYFRANKPQPSGYQFFVHVVDADSGQALGNLDHAIQNGVAPLGSWPVGKVIEDAHAFEMPNYPGSMGFMLGFWNNQGRLMPDNEALSDGSQRLRGPKLSGAPQLPLPEYRIARTKTPPTIDGAIDDAAWHSASEGLLVGSNDGRPTRVKTTFRMLYDDAFVYVAFDCEDKDVWGSLRKKDDPIYNEDVVEVFLDADADGKTYNELQVSPHNVNFDASFVARRSDLTQAMAWESGMQSAVKVRGTLDDDKADEGWSAEMKIPLAKLTAVPRVPPSAGDRWRFNAYRLEHFVHGRDIEGQAFSPVMVGDFHNLPRFGWLIFE